MQLRYNPYNYNIICIIDERIVANPAGEPQNGVLRLDFDRRVMAEFFASVVTSDAALLAYRELDDELGLSELVGKTLGRFAPGKERSPRVSWIVTTVRLWKTCIKMPMMANAFTRVREKLIKSARRS